jgi:hypothetical protein
MRVAGVCGENTYELEDGGGCRELFTLPNRLRHVVFIRPGSYVLALRDDELVVRGARIIGEIQAAILDTHLAELRLHPRWPPAFSKQNVVTAVCDSRLQAAAFPSETPIPMVACDEPGDAGNEGRVELDSSEESDLEGNPNQRKADRYESSSAEG